MFNNLLATITLTDFTDAMTSVSTAVTSALGTTITTGLAIGGVILGGFLIWKLFKKVIHS